MGPEHQNSGGSSSRRFMHAARSFRPGCHSRTHSFPDLLSLRRPLLMIVHRVETCSVMLGLWSRGVLLSLSYSKIPLAAHDLLYRGKGGGIAFSFSGRRHSASPGCKLITCRRLMSIFPSSLSLYTEVRFSSPV